MARTSHATFQPRVDRGPFCGGAQKWGWVLEMYGFTIACYMAGIQPARLHIKMMSQPPWDTKLWPYYLLHYTYGAPAWPTLLPLHWMVCWALFLLG